MQKMRTINQAYLYLKTQDPDTAITKTAFREFVNKGYIPTIVIGNTKKLISLDSVDKFLNEGMPKENKNDFDHNEVRKLNYKIRAL